jgi:hypothetical protein
MTMWIMLGRPLGKVASIDYREVLCEGCANVAQVEIRLYTGVAGNASHGRLQGIQQ